MLTTIMKLREIHQRCLCEQPLESEHLHWLGKSLDAFLSHRCRSLDEAVGLKFARGGVPWWLEEAQRQRDGALRELASRHFPGVSVSAQASRIRLLALRYAGSAWRFDRERQTPLDGYAGTTHEWLWLAFASGAPMPIGERQLRHIIGR